MDGYNCPGPRDFFQIYVRIEVRTGSSEAAAVAGVMGSGHNEASVQIS